MKQLKYAGIGSRKAVTTKTVEPLMRQCVEHLNAFNAICRSGGAEGPDEWCETTSTNVERYLPFAKFRIDTIKQTPYIKTIKTWELPKHIQQQALQLAIEVAPHVKFARYGVQIMHGRNPFQIFGQDLNDPVDFVLCWTKYGKIEGGTATAINLALKNNIPVFNLGAVDGLSKFKQFMKQYTENET